MGLLSGLEKFGLKAADKTDIYKEEQAAKVKKESDAVAMEEEPKEEDFILVKTVRCPVCDRPFKTKMVKSGKVKRLEPDFDLRPRQQYIDSLKYDVSSCPRCGYTALNRYFEHVTTGQIKLIQEQVCTNFVPETLPETPTTDYDTAIDMHKLSLYNAIVKKARTSEKAYNCLILSWLFREKGALVTGDDDAAKQQRQEFEIEEKSFYREAYDGLMKAVSSEMFPICGMDQTTMDYLLANMSFYFKEYETASKCLSRVLTSPNANRKIKDKSLELKDEILKAIKQDKVR